MKILLANKFFHLNGGSERVFFQERNFLLEQGCNIIDFSMDDVRNFHSPFSSFFVSNIDYNKSEGLINKSKQGIKFIHSAEAVRNIESIIRKEGPEIAHLHNIYHQLTPSIISILKKNNVKVALTLHDYKLICPSYLALKDDMICTQCEGKYFWKPFTTNCQKSMSQGLLLMLEAFYHSWKKSYQEVDLFIAPSRFIADLISKRIPKEKIQVLRNGIDVNEYKPIFKDEGYGLYFGRLSREKGLDTLLSAHSLMKNPCPVKIVGTGPLENELQEKYPDIEFLGYKTGEELKNIISMSAFVVVPSVYFENCSMTVLETMALGKPVIGSKVGGIPEQIEDGKTGFLFEMGNIKALAEKMTILAEDQNARKDFGIAARKKLEEDYSLDNHCQKLLRLYEHLLAG